MTILHAPLSGSPASGGISRDDNSIVICRPRRPHTTLHQFSSHYTRRFHWRTERRVNCRQHPLDICVNTVSCSILFQPCDNRLWSITVLLLTVLIVLLNPLILITLKLSQDVLERLELLCGESDGRHSNSI